MFLEKGMLISKDGWWYVVVKIRYDQKYKQIWVYCICDNANNVYSIEPNSIKNYLTLKEIGNLGFDESPLNRLPKDLKERNIPYDVILEVLTGVHDHRIEED